MAGWIKLRWNLEDDPKVQMIARWIASRCHELCPDMLKTCPDIPLTMACGAVAKVWSKVSQHGVRDVRTSSDALLRFGDREMLEKWAGIPGFLDAMASVDWVREEPEGLVFPGFAHAAELMRERSDGKPPMTEAERKRIQRQRVKQNGGCPDNVPKNVRTDVTLDKTRKDKNLIDQRQIDQKNPDGENGNPVDRQAWEAMAWDLGLRLIKGPGCRAVLAQWAYLVLAGELSEAQVGDAINGANALKAAKPAAYATSTLRNNLGSEAYEALMTRAPTRKECPEVPNGSDLRDERENSNGKQR